MEYSLNQSAWRRGWRDTRKVWTSWQFFILDAVVGVVIGSVFQWYWGVGIILFGMLCAWLAVTISAPTRQRNEARRLLSDIPSKRKVIADKLAEFYIKGTELKQTIIKKEFDGDALVLCKRWATGAISYFHANPNELGEARAFAFIPDTSDFITLSIPNVNELDEDTYYAYVLLVTQLGHLKKLVEEFLK